MRFRTGVQLICRRPGEESPPPLLRPAAASLHSRTETTSKFGFDVGWATTHPALKKAIPATAEMFMQRLGILVTPGPFDSINDQDVAGTFTGFEPQSKLFLDRRENRDSAG